MASVASFFISRVDTEVDRRLDAIGSPEALALRGKAAVAQGKLAYQHFRSTFTGPRWEALEARGARLQRPLWASTSTKNAAYPDTLYVDTLIGPDTVNTLPDATIAAFNDHGTLARTVDADVDQAEAVWAALADVGVDMDDVGAQLGAGGRQLLPEELRRAPRGPQRKGPRAQLLSSLLRGAAEAGHPPAPPRPPGAIDAPSARSLDRDLAGSGFRPTPDGSRLCAGSGSR